VEVPLPAVPAAVEVPVQAPDAEPPVPSVAPDRAAAHDDSEDLSFRPPPALLRSILEVIGGLGIGDEDLPAEGFFNDEEDPAA
jgi:hypothetical protein